MEYKKIQNIIARVLQLDLAEITDDADLVYDLGADSLEIFQIVTEIEKEFEISIPSDTLHKERTVGGLYHMVADVKQANNDKCECIKLLQDGHETRCSSLWRLKYKMILYESK